MEGVVIKMSFWNNKKVLITGATGRIGGSIAKKFLSRKSEVLGTGTNLSKLEKLSEILDH